MSNLPKNYRPQDRVDPVPFHNENPQVSVYDALCIADKPKGYPKWARITSKKILEDIADGLDAYGDIKPSNKSINQSPLILSFFLEKIANLA